MNNEPWERFIRDALVAIGVIVIGAIVLVFVERGTVSAQHPLPRPIEHQHSEYQHFQEPYPGTNECLHVVMRANAIAVTTGRCWR